MRASLLSRGEPGTAKIAGKERNGFWLSAESIGATRFEADQILQATAPALSPAQRWNFVDLIVAIGLAESVYPVNRRAFSIRRQIGGPAIGFTQVEPETAIDVMERAADGPAALAINAGMQRILGVGLVTFGGALRAMNRAQLEDALQPNAVQALILRLKFGNRGWKDIPGWEKGETLDLFQQARVWKQVWNTALGKGTEPGFCDKVREHRALIT